MSAGGLDALKGVLAGVTVREVSAFRAVCEEATTPYGREPCRWRGPVRTDPADAVADKLEHVEWHADNLPEHPPLPTGAAMGSSWSGVPASYSRRA